MATTRDVVNDFVVNAKGVGVWPLIQGCYLYLGGGILAAQVPLVTNGNPLWASVGTGGAYSDADYAQSTGLITRVNEALDLGINPFTGMTLNDTHLMLMFGEAVTTNHDFGSAGIGLTFRMSHNASTAYSDDRGRLSPAIAVKGVLIGTRTAAASHKLYLNGVEIDSVAGNNGEAALPAFNLYGAGFNNAGAVANTAAGNKLLALGWGKGLDATKAGQYDGLLHTLMASAPINRNVP